MTLRVPREPFYFSLLPQLIESIRFAFDRARIVASRQFLQAKGAASRPPVGCQT